MKLLVFADLHLETRFAQGSREAARGRRQGLRDTLRRIASLACEERVDALLCAGDLYEHDRFTGDTQRFLRDTFAELGPMPVLIAPGNHDWFGPASIYAQVQWSTNVRVFTGDRLERMELADGLSIWGAAHRKPVGTAGFLDSFRVQGGGIHLGLFHGSEQGGLQFEEEGKQRHAPFAADSIPGTGLHHAFVGHYHTPADGEFHTYPGNPDPLAFGEHGPRAAVVVEVGSDGSVTRRREPVAVTMVHDVELRFEEVGSSADIVAHVEQALAPLRGWVRLRLSGDVPPEVDLQPADLEGVAGHLECLHVDRFQLEPAYDLDSISGEQNVRGQFLRDVRAAGLDTHEERRVIITGLRAFDGRQDLEVY